MYYCTVYDAAATMAENFDNIDNATQTVAVLALHVDLMIKDEIRLKKKDVSRPRQKSNLFQNFDAVRTMLNRHNFTEIRLYDDRMCCRCFFYPFR